jgi:hypothetical protein
MEFSKCELKLIAALGISPGRELSRDRAAALFDRPSEFERTLRGLVKHGVCSSAPVTGAVGLSVQMAARFLDLEGPVQEQPALDWQDDELNRARRELEAEEEARCSPHGPPEQVRAESAQARENLARCAENAQGLPRCECGNPQHFGDDVPPGLRETLVAMGVCDRHARERGFVRTYVSTFRTSLSEVRTNVLGGKPLEDLERTLREPKWERRTREEPAVMQRALASARAQIERGFVPRTPNGWFYRHHYKPAGGKLD